jgi:hypothetical protein
LNFIERFGICNETFPYTGLFYNEYLQDSNTFTDWIQEQHNTDEWYNAYFQITIALYSLQRYFNMTHFDLHAENILVKKVKKGGYNVYIINNTKYKVPNLGYIFYIIDFGQAFIPGTFKTYYVSKNRKIHKGFDINYLFKSSLEISTAPGIFKKQILKTIKDLKYNIKNTLEIIEGIWLERYSTRRILNIKETFNLDKELDVKNIPRPLRKLILNI